MRSQTTTPAGKARQEYVDLRLDLVQKLGPSFVNPVQSFIATNGPAKIGALVRFSIFLNAGVDQVQVLRNTAQDVASASVLQSYDAQTVPLHQPLSYYDSDTAILGKKAFYWLRAIPQNKQLQPLLSGPIQVQIPQTGDSSLLPPNEVSNSTNFATVDSIVDSGAATVRIYGTGGLGSSWVRKNGDGTTQSYPSGQISGLAFGTTYQVFWNGASYQAFAGYPTTLPDNLIFAGKVTTVSSTGTGGTVGGGTAAGGIGGNRVAQSVGASSTLLETNSVPNAVQSTLNLTQKNSSALAPNITLTDAGTGEIDLTVPGDSLIHGDALWEIDPGYMCLRDDFLRGGTASGAFGELRWALNPAPVAPTYVTGAAPNLGGLVFPNTATANQVDGLFLQAEGTQLNNQMAWNLLNTHGWKCTWVFALDSVFTNAPSAGPAFSLAQTSFYIGLGYAQSAVAKGRPDIFVGLRYDTDTTAPAISDTTMKFEAVVNPLISPSTRSNVQGTVVDTGIAPARGTFYRLEIQSVAAGVVTMSINGSAPVSFTVPPASVAISTSPAVAAGFGVAQVGGAAATGGWLALPWASGGSITVSGLAGGDAVLNGTQVVRNTGALQSIFSSAATIANHNPASLTLSGVPSLMPYMTFGNDTTATPVGSTKELYLDLFGFLWNPGVGGGVGVPDKTKARYF